MYKKEDLRFFKMDTFGYNGSKIFSIEDELSNEEKIKFIDDLKDGLATYTINLITKWEAEKDSLPKNHWGDVKTVSEKAWIKRNDERHIIDIDFNIGNYRIFGTNFTKMSLICPGDKYGNHLYTGCNIVKQWFHDLCLSLYYDEKKYFESIDSVEIKISKVKEYGNYLNTIFDSQKLNDIVWNGDKDVSEDELDIYIEAYKRVENCIKTITKDVSSKVDSLHQIENLKKSTVNNK